MPKQIRVEGRRRWIVLVVIGLLIVMGLVAFVPPNTQNVTSQPHPVDSYDQAVQRIEGIQAEETSTFNPVCRLQLMTHGKKVERAVIFVHGYTFCPQMFQVLASKFYDLGYNVLIPPLPHHGLADRLNTDQVQLTAEEMAAYSDQVVDLAQGLGDQVTMVGISAGGVVTAWAAENRSDLDLAVPISPGFGFAQIPAPLTVPAANIYLWLPNSFQWWDPDLKEAVGPPNTYPRYSTHALAQILRFSFAAEAKARQTAPLAHSILVITNDNDMSVDNAATAVVVNDWRSHGARDLQTFSFNASLKLGHDLIDPARPDQRTDIVYPKLIDLITNR